MLDYKQKSSYTIVMNKLNRQQRKTILNLLVEGSSMRSISRAAGVSINTVTKLLVDAGLACAEYHDKAIHNVKSKRVQCDEIWSFCYPKKKNVDYAVSAPDGAGDVWTWTALDSDIKLIISYLVGGRDSEYALEFMDDVRARLADRVQLTTDGHRAYLEAVEGAFGEDVDYAQLVKLYGNAPKDEQIRYSPATCIGARRKKVNGQPDIESVSTSHVERHNLTMCMSMRRFTRLTNAFSKKIDNHIHALSLYFVYYNFCRIHKSLKVTPAMEAGLTDKLHDIGFIVDLIDAREPKNRKRGPYKKRISN